jgi:uncharacterized repeat protein (TIGR04052 family)
METRSPWQTPDVALIDFEDGTGPCETSGNSAMNNRITGKVPKEYCLGVAFSLSVPEELNHGDPTEAPAPLQVTAMQWNWLLGYKFMRAEVKPVMKQMSGEGGAPGHMNRGGADQAGGMGGAAGAAGQPGTGAMDSQFHLGSLACANDGGDALAPPAGSCMKPNRAEIRFDLFHPGEDLIEVDLAEIMKNIDLSKMNHCHGMPNDSCPAFYASVGLDYDSGEAKKTQSAFRVHSR